MIAAIYARKSTDQRNVAEDAKSVTRQIDNAKRFAASKGWTVDPAYIYVDDGVSGAALRKLHARQRMLDLIYSGRAPFQVLIVQASDRLSRRDGDEAFAEQKRIARAGIELWFYAKGERFTFGDFRSNVTGILEREFGAEFRRAITEKTTESLLKKFRDGYVTGNLPFGYEGVRTPAGVKARFKEAEAEVVRRMYQMAADGVGLKRIAHTLNSQGLAAPRPQQGRIGGWSPSSVRVVLLNEKYEGRFHYGRTKKRDADGDENRSFRPESQWQVQDFEHLRIVPEALAKAVRERYGAKRDKYLRGAKGRILGRPSSARYLLTGLIKCPTCGGSFEAQTRPHGRRPGGVYMCSIRLRKGPAKCSSTLTLPIVDTELAILEAIQREMLDPAFVERVLDSAFANALSRKSGSASPARSRT
jgi:site-specific DNA recombinase